MNVVQTLPHESPSSFTALPDPAPQVDPSLAAVLHVLSHVTPSADPKQVLQSLARAAVPVLCDSATVVLEVEREQPLYFSHPGTTAGGESVAISNTAITDALGGHRLTANSVTTPVESPSTEGQKGYRGTLVLSYHGYQPSSAQALIGHLLVLQANALVAHERMLDKAGHLERALASNREIGSAMGILMISHKLTSEQAFDLLRRTSQHGHRKLSVVAREVVETGVLELPSGVRIFEDGATPAAMPRRSRHTSRIS